MNITEAREAIARQLGEDAAKAVEGELDTLLAASLAYDSEGRLPGSAGYIVTHDERWLAAEAADSIAIKQAAGGGLTKFTSEGASFEIAQPDWEAIARRLRAMSPWARILAALHGSTGTGMLEVDGSVGYDHTSQSWPDGRRARVVGNWL